MLEVMFGIHPGQIHKVRTLYLHLSLSDTNKQCPLIEEATREAPTSTYDFELCRFARTSSSEALEISAKMRDPFAPSESFPTLKVAFHALVDQML